jgi:hypothetical protein
MLHVVGNRDFAGSIV